MKILLDVSASYPNGEAVFNISKETTKKELCSIEGVSEAVRRAQGINLSGGATNAVEVATGLLKVPQLHTWLHAYRQRTSLEVVARELQEMDDSSGSAEALSKLREESEEEY